MSMEDWVECELGEVLRIKNGFAFKSKEYIDSGIPVIRIGDINNWEASINDAKYIKENPEYNSYIINKGDILIAMSGATTGKFGIFKSDGKAYQNQRVGNILPLNSDYLNKSFIFYLLYSLKKDIEKDAYGGAQPNISSKKIENLKIILPPLPIQRAIVTKIENLFASLDKGIEDLKLAKEQLKIYRQAVLKKAFEGELTKEWREKQTDLPTADELLEQIKVERENHYQKQVEEWEKAVKDWEDNGKVGKKPGKPRRFKDIEISEFVKIELPIIHSNSVYVAFGQLFNNSPINGVYKPSTEYGEGTEIIRIDNIYDGCLTNLTSLKRVKISDSEIKKFKINEGDILINRVNSIEYLGKCGSFNTIKDSIVFESNIMKISLNRSILPKYITNYLTSVLGLREIKRFAKHAVNQASINQTDVSLTPIPLPSLLEQRQIVREIESRLSVCDKVEQSIAEALEKSEALRQSILKKAFEGRLLTDAEIEQCKKEADYEPASVLLQRIKREKAEA